MHSEHSCHGLRGGLLAAVISLAVSTSGCSVYHPLISPSHPDPSKPITYSTALACAYEQENAYSRRATEQAFITPFVGTLLIPVAGAAIALNAAGMSGDILTFLGVGGATAITYGTLFRNGPRERAYLFGATAVDCAIRTTQPLGASDEELETFSDDLHGGRAGLPTRIAELRDTIEKAGQACSGTPTGALKDQLDAADSRMTTAIAKLSEGLGVEKQLKMVARQLLDALAKIRDAVNEAVRNTEQDLSTLVTSLKSSLPATTQSYFGAGFVGTPPPAPEAGAAPRRAVRPDKCADPNTNLQHAIQDVDETLGRVNSFIQNVTLDGTANLDSCLTTLTAGLQQEALKVDPTALELKAGGDPGSVTVSGGVPPYTVELVGDDAKKALTKEVQALGRKFVLRGQAGGTGTYVASVSDSANHAVNVLVTVKP